jgi:hypothetical protein
MPQRLYNLHPNQHPYFMVQICNQAGKPTAYLIKNIIVNLTNFDAIGVVLGNCIFNKEGLFVGKTRRHCIYNGEGEIMGTMLLNEQELDSLNSQIVNAGWHIVEQIKNHGCSWIEEKQQWANMSFEEVLA